VIADEAPASAVSPASPDAGRPGDRPGDHREIGWDLARSFAIVMMVLINFQLMLARAPDAGGSDHAEQILRWLVHVPSGRSSSLFVVLAGAGFSLLTRRARLSGDRVELRVARRTVLLRAVFLFLLGNALLLVWSIDILHFYACYLTIAALLFLRARGFVLALVAVLVTVLAAALDVALPERAELPYLSPAGLALDVLVDGVHPILPWLAFVAYGAWLGRRDLADVALRRTFLVRAALVVVLVELGSLALAYLALRVESLAPLRPHLGLLATAWDPDPLFVVSACGSATVMITLAHELVSRPRIAASLPVRALVSTGQLALSVYLTHAIVGVVIPRYLLGLGGHSLSVVAVTVYWLGFVLVVIVLSAIYRRFLPRGPLEWVMRLVTSWRLPSERAVSSAPRTAPLEAPKARAPAGPVRALAWSLVALGGVVLVLARVVGMGLGETQLEGPARLPAMLSGELSLARPRAVHRLSLDRTRSVTLETRSGLDLYLELDALEPGGPRRIAEDDDGGDGLDARVSRELAPGEYSVTVRPYAATTGPYLLAIF